MPFPALALSAGRTNLSSATGVPDNGENVIAHNWTMPASKVRDAQVEVDVQALGPSVSSSTFLGVSADGLSLRISFVQLGTDEATVVARHVHSVGA